MKGTFAHHREQRVQAAFSKISTYCFSRSWQVLDDVHTAKPTERLPDLPMDLLLSRGRSVNWKFCV